MVELKKEWASACYTVINKLYNMTPLQTTFGIILLALVQGKPEVLSLKDLLQHFLNWRRTVIIRRTQYDLRKAKDRLHILEGYLKALSHIDEIIELIKKSQTPKEAKERDIKVEYAKNIKLFVNGFENKPSHKKIIKAILNLPPYQYLKTYIPKSDLIENMPFEKMSVVEKFPKSQEAKIYEKLFNEIV